MTISRRTMSTIVQTPKPSSTDLSRLHAFLSSSDHPKFNLSSRFTIAQHMEHVKALVTSLHPLLLSSPTGTQQQQQQDRIVDLGSGSGVLGFICALTYPHVQFTLLESRAKCCDFLERGVIELGLSSNSNERSSSRVVVCHSRAETLGMSIGHRHLYDGVMSRRFGPSGTTAECAAPLLRQGGFLLVSDPPAAALSSSPNKNHHHLVRWPKNGLSKLGLTLEIRSSEMSAVTMLRATESCSEIYPRSRRIKFPLF
eukprot:CAMPEP_0195527552 /NCGR_PEP_ID=MMETSP0794_2-20130614/29276_1 /TAXON_ID=515487 /ORGANISM="Stephanopyxis turris, Strain CCMP 815" /LENGTH=254 /DNA_ID=CAMNT_0040658481 /DNA_START=104 /DNA_END=868 /DNA_ORIENTATION=-